MMLIMEIYTVSFFGHRRIYNQLYLDQKLDELILRLLKTHSYIEFLVGRDGDFDQLVSSAIKRCQRQYGHHNSSHIWVMPYPTSFFRDNEQACYDYYDEIEICEESSVKHFKAAFRIRNRNMVDRSDLVVFYVENDLGGAYQTMKYAAENSKEYLNLYHSKENLQ